MTSKIISFLLTMLVNAAAGVVVFFGMIVAMNGYHESDATYGIAAYVVLAVAVTLGMSGLAALATHLLEKRGFPAWVAVLIGTAVFSAIGIVLKLICSIIGVGIAEFVRVNY